MIIIDGIPQGSKDWIDLRLGVVTASGCKQLFSFGQKTGWCHPGCDTWHTTEEIACRCRKGCQPPQELSELTISLSTQRTTYRNKLLGEWATGAPVEEWMGNYWTERGQQLEGEASDFFSMETNLNLKPCAFVFRDDSRTCGASPDALVISDDGEIIGGLEIKCPHAGTHVGYLLDGRSQYEEQIQMSLWASQLPVWYFLSYHPELPPHLETVQPIEEYQRAFDELLPPFLRELEDGRDRLRKFGVNK